MEMQNIVTIFKQQLKYFQIESYSQNWQIADSHERVQAQVDKKKNIIFIILLFSNLFACLNVLLTSKSDTFLFHSFIKMSNVVELGSRV